MNKKLLTLAALCAAIANLHAAATGQSISQWMNQHPKITTTALGVGAGLAAIPAFSYLKPYAAPIAQKWGMTCRQWVSENPWTAAVIGGTGLAALGAAYYTYPWRKKTSVKTIETAPTYMVSDQQRLDTVQQHVNDIFKLWYEPTRQDFANLRREKIAAIKTLLNQMGPNALESAKTILPKLPINSNSRNLIVQAYNSAAQQLGVSQISYLHLDDYISLNDEAELKAIDPLAISYLDNPFPREPFQYIYPLLANKPEKSTLLRNVVLRPAIVALTNSLLANEYFKEFESYARDTVQHTLTHPITSATMAPQTRWVLNDFLEELEDLHTLEREKGEER